eukprot:2684100-Heterocapsa_arctica.AAC.1
MLICCARPAATPLMRPIHPRFFNRAKLQAEIWASQRPPLQPQWTVVGDSSGPDRQVSRCGGSPPRAELVAPGACLS